MSTRRFGGAGEAWLGRPHDGAVVPARRSRLSRLPRLAAALGVAALAWLWSPASAAPDPASATDLGNQSCLSCHEESRGPLHAVRDDGTKRALRPVAAADYANGVHSLMECVTCHLEIRDSATPHRKTPGESKPDCLSCHADLASQLKRFKTADERRGIRNVAAIIKEYQASSHAKPDRNDPSIVRADCNRCHDVHGFAVPSRGSPARTDWRLGLSDLCGRCHDAHLEEWSESVHGRRVKQDQDASAANCVDCHTAHAVLRPRADATKLFITSKCGDCHEDAYASYRQTYHGQVATLGYTHTAKCFDCHGSHDVDTSDNPESRMHLDNRLDTCQRCHAGDPGGPAIATAGFVSFSPHGRTDDFATYPQLWLASKLMNGLLIGTFAFFWAHSLLWLYREWRERRTAGRRPGAATAGATPHAGMHIRRFGLGWRAAHLLFAVSLMLLTTTGISLFYPDAPWARTLVGWLGGPKTAGLLHRAGAVVFIVIFLAHLVYVVTGIARRWKTFRIFGPDSLIPGPQDIRDILSMFKWFLGRGPRPRFDRWTYWEKFDYWAPFWGVTIIGVSGLMLWFPHVTAAYLPGWVFNVATVFHGEEAFLAVVFLFTVHFFNNHFRPAKFPLDRVMFTGTMSVEELEKEHALQYQRLVDSGELSQQLVAPPSRLKTQLTGILGFALIAAGLTLLTLVVIGFFSGP